NVVFPTMVTWFGHRDFASLSATFESGYTAETNGYLSVALVFAFASWWVCEGRSRLFGRLLAVAFALSLLLALGSHLHVAGHAIVPLPFDLVRNLPVLDGIVPS